MRKSIMNTYNIIIICRVHYETYILYYIARVQSADFTRVSKTTESGIGRKDGNLLSFFSRSYFPRRDWGEVVTGEKNYRRISHTHTNYFVHTAYVVFTDRVSSDSRARLSITLHQLMRTYILYIISLYVPTRNAHIPMR